MWFRLHAKQNQIPECTAMFECQWKNRLLASPTKYVVTSSSRC